MCLRPDPHVAEPAPEVGHENSYENSKCGEAGTGGRAMQRKCNDKPQARERAKWMVDSSGLKLVGLIFASVTIAVMLTTTMVVKDYADGTYTLEGTASEGR